MTDQQLTLELSKLTPEELKKFESLEELLNDKFKAFQAFKRFKVQESNDTHIFAEYY